MNLYRMPAIGLVRPWPQLAVLLGIFIIPLLLFLPALHYSLDTPIGLMENSPRLAHKFDGASSFLNYLHTAFVEAGRTRFRPFYEVWNGLVWKVFGEVAWVHHLGRWLLHFGAFAFCIAAFRRFSSSPEHPGLTAGRALRIIPVALLTYLLLFFPNLPTVRIEAVELHTIFFLSLCNWAAALVLTAGREGDAKQQALFCLGYIGLLLSKEINVAPALWLLVCWWALAIAKGLTAGKCIVGAMLALAFAVAVHRVNAALKMAEIRGLGFVPSSAISDRFPENAADILQGLFQYETSAAVTTVFILLLLVLAVAVAAKFSRRRFDGELAFILLLLGEFISMFLMLSLQYGTTLRYWSILVPCLATLLAFAAKFLLQAAKRHRSLAKGGALTLGAFIAFFVSANYYNFLYQVIAQHSARNLDALVVAELAPLLNSGKYVQANPYDWHFEEMQELNYPHIRKSHWPNAPYGSRRIRRAPPKDPQQPYYFLDIAGPPDLAGSFHARLVGRTDYGILGYAAKLANLMQGGAPHASLDWGMHKLGWYRWDIHALGRNPEGYVDRLTAAAGTPVAQSVFNVYFDGAKVMYAKNPCHEGDVRNFFFLHLTPARVNDLPRGRRSHGFDNLDFLITDYGIKIGDACLAVRTLPPYPLRRIRTGQYVLEDGALVWKTEFSVVRRLGR